MEEYFVAPFEGDDFYSYVMKELIVSPLLLLLDPVEYFRRYSIIIKKYWALNKGHTLGIYELLLGYFPEMDDLLVEKYWMARSVFYDNCVDIAAVIGRMIVDMRM